MDSLQAETEYAAKVLDSLVESPSTLPSVQFDEEKTRNAAGCMTVFLGARLASKGTQPQRIKGTTFQWSNGIINMRNAVRHDFWTNLRPTFVEHFEQLSGSKPSAYLMVAWQPTENTCKTWAIPGRIVHDAIPSFPVGEVKDKKSVWIIPGKNVFERCGESPDLAQFYRSIPWSDEEKTKLIEAATIDAAGRRTSHSETELTKIAALATEEGYFSPARLQDERARRLREIVERRGQPSFRNKLLSAYDGRCAVTGCDAVAALEAAHIVPYCGPQSNHVSNGLLFRADIHTLFDLELMGIDPQTLTIAVSTVLSKTTYREFHGRKISVPNVVSDRPNAQALRKRWRLFSKK